MSGNGGMYAALLGKKNSKASASGASQNKSTSAKSAKVMSLKDMKADKKPVAAKKEEVAKEDKKPVEQEKTRDLTRREQKDAQKSTDRHVPRSGHGDFKQKDRDAVKVCSKYSCVLPHRIHCVFVVLFHVHHTSRQHTSQQHTSQQQDELAGGNDARDAERDARRKEREEEDEIRRKKAEEEAKMVWSCGCPP